MDKNQYYQSEILRFLLSNPNCSVVKVSEAINLSEKTARLKINQLDDLLQERGIGKIDKTPRKGIVLEIFPNKQTKLSKLLVKIDFPSDSITEKTIFFLLKQKRNNYITHSRLAEELFVSLPTLRKAICEAKEWFKRFDIEIVATRNKGLKLVGEEYSFRRAIKNYILTDPEGLVLPRLTKFTAGLNVNQIKEVIKQVEKSWKIQFSKESLKRIWIMVCLSVHRRTTIQDNFIEHDMNIESYTEYNFSGSIYALLEKNGYHKFSQTDKKVLAYEILSSNKLSWTHPAESISLNQDKQIVSFVEKIISSISDVLHQDLTEDTVLQKDLAEHLRSAIFRMKYGHKNGSELSIKLKEDYNRVYLSVWATSQLFEKYYGVQITESEVSYIVLYVEAALLRKNNTVSAIYVTNQGRSQAQFVIELIKHNVPQIKKIEMIRESVVLPPRQEGDIIISDVYRDDPEVISISPMPKNQDFEAIRSALGHVSQNSTTHFHFSKSVQPLFDPNLIFMDVSICDKYELLKMMSGHLEETGSVSSSFFESVWHRELKTSTCIGNHAAIPHGAMSEINEPKIAVATLTNSIKWFDEEDVNIVFLLATKMNSTINITRTKDFYMDLIRLTEKKEAVKEFLAMKDGKEVYSKWFV